MDRDIIAIVGMGHGGSAILETILQIPEIYIKAVYDNNPEAPGLTIARSHNVPIIEIQHAVNISFDPEVEFIFEVTGKREVYEQLKSNCNSYCTVIGAATTRIIFHLLDAQQNANDKLEAYKNGLELAIIQRTEELENANKQLEMKILDHERLNEKLQRVNDEKTRYLLQATHQLKAPFAAIQSYTDIILGGYTGELPEMSKNVVEKIKLRCELLSRAIKEMLELANLKSVLPENIQMTNTSLNERITDSINNVKIIARQKNIIIKYSPQDTSIQIKCNAEQMRILFNILLENAINYSPNDSQIDVSTHLEINQYICISVKDQGIGIAKEHHNKIFQEYFRTNESVQQHPDGTGLGLSIAKQIIDLHGFNLTLDSQPNQGSNFMVRIPFIN